jgi:hypothetical protein
MAKILISYDLRIPGRNYQPLYGRLAEWSAIRVLESVWVANVNANVAEVRNDLQRFIDGNDGLLVVALTALLRGRK